MYEITSFDRRISRFAMESEFLGAMVQEVSEITDSACIVKYATNITLVEYAAMRVNGTMMEVMVAEQDGRLFCFSTGAMMPWNPNETPESVKRWFDKSVEALGKMSEDPDKPLLSVFAEVVGPDLDLVSFVKKYPGLLDI